ncbi:hypothetical protein CEXT_473691 [Caerostris extrusa]|uniref:Uncharacterized protein n=1 Tax=Caerostris extrusa TaxID=172846 RepID=A0AAV4MXU0_CAEEX|nr:hypothetical protein CEXT_473691 [Caerostris extrusa]
MDVPFLCAPHECENTFHQVCTKSGNVLSCASNLTVINNYKFLMVPMEVTGRQRSIRRITLEEDILHIVDQTPSFGAVKCSSPKTLLTNIFFYTKRDYTVTSSESSLTAGVRTSAKVYGILPISISTISIYSLWIFCQNGKFFIFLQELPLQLLAIKVLYSCIPTVVTFPSL